MGTLEQCKEATRADWSQFFVTQWINGIWPARQQRLSTITTELIDMIAGWPDIGVEPRQRHCQWVRHIYRCFNTIANDLATNGEQLRCNDVQIICSDTVDIHGFEYIRGLWDGGHDPGTEVVGIGFEI